MVTLSIKYSVYILIVNLYYLSAGAEPKSLDSVLSVFIILRASRCLGVAVIVEHQIPHKSHSYAPTFPF